MYAGRYFAGGFRLGGGPKGLLPMAEARTTSAACVQSTVSSVSGRRLSSGIRHSRTTPHRDEPIDLSHYLGLQELMFENEGGRRGPVLWARSPVTRRPHSASVSSWVFSAAIASGVGHRDCELFLCAVAEACTTQRLREENAAVGFIPLS